jgi:flagellar hook-associated protein 1 FlgK
MRSSFLGLEIARSAILASQIALDVTGQNVSNADTEIYTRQRADMVALNYSAGVNRFAQPASSNVGQGVNVEKISQIRDFFLDKRLRTANSDYRTWETTVSALKDIEAVFDEKKTDGLHAMLGDFYNQLQGLSNHIGEKEFANIVRSSAVKVTQVLHQYAAQLTQAKNQQYDDLKIEADQVNTLIDNINNLNDMIKDQTLRGSVSNELLDQRNDFLDKLSGYINITVIPQADGTVSVKSTDGITDEIEVLDSKFSIEPDPIDPDTVVKIKIVGKDDCFIPLQGSMKGHLEAINGAGTYADVSAGESEMLGITYYQRALDNFAEAFAGTFNEVNSLIKDPMDETKLIPGPVKNLFEGTTAADINISAEWNNDSEYIVCTNENIMRMINAMNVDIDTSKYPKVSGTFEGFSKILMSNIAVDVGYQTDMKTMKGNILDAVSNQRESIMGVSTTEETINMTKYQRSFQAASRLMTILDEALNTIINNMGIVGR